MDKGAFDPQQLIIREAHADEFELIWPIFSDVVQRGDTYAYEPDIGKQEAERLWLLQTQRCYVALVNEQVVGSYYIKTNQSGPGKHVCNCGYMVSSAARGKGAATAMCLHSQQQALELGYLAMQFNFVAASNEVAVNLWLKLGFEKVGRLPKAFNHPKLGLVDAFVMHKSLV